MTRREKSDPLKVLAYRSLYMDARESYGYAETQIDQCIATSKTPAEKIILAFDIIATPAQISSGLAHQWGQHMLDYCDQHYPKLSARIVGISDDENRRVGRDIVITGKLSGSEIDDVHLIEME